MSTCTVCGGDVKNGRCISCGMSQAGERSRQTNYQNNNKYYQNQNNYNNIGQNQYGGFGAKKKKNPIFTLLIIFGVFFFVGVGLGIVAFSNMATQNLAGDRDVYESIQGEALAEESYEYDEEPEDEIAPEVIYDDNEFAINIASGAYIVGIHLPAGTYDIEILDPTGYEWGYLDVMRDGDTAIYESFDEAEGLSNIELIDGDGIRLESSSLTNFLTDNAQPFSQDRIENPLTQVIYIGNYDYAIAGIDFPSGTYDVYPLENDWGHIEIDIYDDFYANQSSYYSFYENDITGNLDPIRNLEMPTGTKVSLFDASAELVPSEYDTLLNYFDFEKEYIELNASINEKLILENYQRQSVDKPVQTFGEENLG